MIKNKEKLREVISYLIFGVLTTAVGMLTYFGILWLGENLLSITPSENAFYLVRIAAQILHWIAAVLFAFFTNKRWVFTSADKDVSVIKQLVIFAGGRLATLGLDTLLTFGTVWVLQAIKYEAIDIKIFSITSDVISKIVASVFVIIVNYFISKIFVFKDKK